MPKTIDSATVKAARERHSELREWSDDPEIYLGSDHAVDRKVAEEFGVSVFAVRAWILGQSHPDAGGPIDHVRRQRLALLESETEIYGPEVAQARLAMRRKNLDPNVVGVTTVATVVVTRPDGTEVSRDTYPAGYGIHVTTGAAS